MEVEVGLVAGQSRLIDMIDMINVTINDQR